MADSNATGSCEAKRNGLGYGDRARREEWEAEQQRKCEKGNATPDREAAIAPLVKAGMTREEAIAFIRAAIRRASR